MGGLVGPIVVLLLAALGGIYALSSLSRASRMVKHTDEVRVAVARLRSTLIDAETGARGYLVTGDRTFLEPYDRARRDWPSDLQGLRSLTSDNPAQQARLAELERLIKERVALLARLELPEAPTPRAPALLGTMLEGKQTMDAARGVIDEMEVAEVRLDGVRQREAERRWQGTVALFVAIVLVFGNARGPTPSAGGPSGRARSPPCACGPRRRGGGRPRRTPSLPRCSSVCWGTISAIP
jgi:CHASE3 domain sensor protein